MKSSVIEKLLEQQSESMFGRSRLDSIATLKCVCCGKEVTSFKDELSKHEFTISGMCQACQDTVF